VAYALVGTIGAVSVGTSGAAVTPAWGTSESRTAGDLLVCWVAVAGSATLPAPPATWSVGVQEAGTTSSVSVFYKVAAGSDTAPTIAAITSGIMSVQLAEYNNSGGGSAFDQYGSASGTTSTETATAGAVDSATGDLIIVVTGQYYSAAATKTLSVTSNNATLTSTSNATTSTADHYVFAYGLTTAKAAADTAVLTFTTTTITGAETALCTFKTVPSHPVQTGDSGGSEIASGSPATIFTANTGTGHAVAIAILALVSTPGVVTGVTSPIGTFTKVQSYSVDSADSEWWVCLSSTGAGTTVTVTTTGAVGYVVWGQEWNRAASAATSASGATGGGTAPALTVSPGAAGNATIVWLNGNGAISAAPARWASYNGAGAIWSWGDDDDVAWLIAPSTSNVTATWTAANAGWDVTGIVLAFFVPLPFRPSFVPQIRASYYHHKPWRQRGSGLLTRGDGLARAT